MGAAHVAIPGAVRVAGPPQGADGASRALATAIDGAVGMGMKLAAREHALTEQTRMEERLLAARKEFGEWREQYQREHQGSDALDAGEAFQAKFAEIAGRHLEAFGGAGNEVFRRQLGGRLAAAGVLAREQGAAYASGQRQAWDRSVMEGRKAQLLADAENAPENGAWLAFQLEAFGQSLAARGQDPTADLLALGSAVQLRRGQALAARGDFDGALALAHEGRGAGSLAGGGKGGGRVTLPGDVAAELDAAARRHGIAPELLRAVAHRESGGRQEVVSRAGAAGVMQLMPGTAAELGVDARDRAQNIEGGARYLKMMLDRYGGNEEHALAAYNWGPGNVDAWLKTGRGRNGQPMPEETRAYVPGVLAGAGRGGKAEDGTGGLLRMSPSDALRLRGFVEAQKKKWDRARGEQIAAFGAGMAEEALPAGEVEARITATYADPEEREDARRAFMTAARLRDGMAEYAQKKERQNRYAEAAAAIAAPGATPRQMSVAIRGADAKDWAALESLARKRLAGDSFLSDPAQLARLKSRIVAGAYLGTDASACIRHDFGPYVSDEDLDAMTAFNEKTRHSARDSSLRAWFNTQLFERFQTTVNTLAERYKITPTMMASRLWDKFASDCADLGCVDPDRKRELALSLFREVSMTKHWLVWKTGEKQPAFEAWYNLLPEDSGWTVDIPENLISDIDASLKARGLPVDEKGRAAEYLLRER